MGCWCSLGLGKLVQARAKRKMGMGKLGRRGQAAQEGERWIGLSLRGKEIGRADLKEKKRRNFDKDLAHDRFLTFFIDLVK